VQRLKR